MAEAPAPSFRHHGRVEQGRDHLFRIYQCPDPVLRESLFASLLVENAIVLLSGTYGTGKTQLVHLVRKIFFGDGAGGYEYDYETCHQDLTAFDVLYHLDLAELQRGREIVHPKRMIRARLKFLNEIQRAGTTFFNALLPFFSEHRITYRDAVFEIPPFVCIMDRNPQDAGSSEIPEAFLDRIDYEFDLSVVHLEEVMKILEIRRTEQGVYWGDLEAMTEPAMSFPEFAEVWADVRRVRISDRVVMLAGMLSDALRLCIVTERSNARVDFDLECEKCQFQGEVCAHVLKVPGMRITNSALRLAQSLAWMERAPEVGAQHVLRALPWCLSHRLALRPEVLRSKPSAQSWVRETGVRELLAPKLGVWERALRAYDSGDQETLRKYGENDLVVRELAVMAEGRDRQGSAGRGSAAS